MSQVSEVQNIVGPDGRWPLPTLQSCTVLLQHHRPAAPPLALQDCYKSEVFRIVNDESYVHADTTCTVLLQSPFEGLFLIRLVSNHLRFGTRVNGSNQCNPTFNDCYKSEVFRNHLRFGTCANGSIQTSIEATLDHRR